MSKFTKPKLSTKAYADLDKRSSAVFSSPIKEDDVVTLVPITDEVLNKAENEPVKLSNGQEVKFVPVSESPRLSLTSLALPTYRDENCLKAVKRWAKHPKVVNISANGHKNVVDHADKYNKAIVEHQTEEGVVTIKCVETGIIPELKRKDGTVAAKGVTWRIWLWEN